MALHFVSYGFVVWRTSLCWKLQLKTLRSLDAELPFSLQRISNSYSEFRFFVTSLPWTRGLRTDGFLFTACFGTSNRMPIFLGEFDELAHRVFLTLVFTESLEGKLHQCHFLSTKGLQTLLGSHSSRENTCSWSYFEVVKNLRTE